MAKFTILTQLSLLISCKLSFPIVGLMFENSVLRRIFRLKRDDIIGGCRKLHIEQLHNLYSSLNIMIKARKVRSVRACGTHRRDEKGIQGFDGKTRRKETTRKT
jgi:hypothetical protein